MIDCCGSSLKMIHNGSKYICRHNVLNTKFTIKIYEYFLVMFYRIIMTVFVLRITELSECVVVRHLKSQLASCQKNRISEQLGISLTQI